MDYKRVRYDEPSSSQCPGSRFLPTFSPSNQNSKRKNNQTLSKRPKLDIDKFTNLSQTSNQCVKQDKDMYDDLWGEDPDITTLEEVDETLALSQMAETTTFTRVQSNVNILTSQNNSARPQTNKDAYQSTSTKMSTPVFIGNKAAPHNYTRNSPKVPLRRVASSGAWPSTNVFTHVVENSMNSIKHSFNNIRINEESNNLSVFEKLKLENENLKENLTKKTGEANVLRDRLQSMQLESDKLKLESMNKIVAIREEGEKNISDLSREIKSLKAQLDVKVMEIETAKRRTEHLASTNRLQPDSANKFQDNIRSNIRQIKKGVQLICGGSNQMRGKSFSHTVELLKQLISPEILKPTQPEPTIIEPFRTITNSGLFSGPVDIKQGHSSSEAHSSKSNPYVPHRAVKGLMPSVTMQQLSVPCPSMEQCSLSLLSSKLLDMSSDNAHQVISEVLDTCLKILLDLQSQLDSALCPQNRYIEREREVTHCGYKYLNLTEDYNLLSSKELYNNERGICARRALTLLSLLVDISDFAAQQILIK